MKIDERLKTVKQNNYLNKKIVNTNGITLVALVVTIIILLILAGVSIGIIFNSDGLFKKASGSATRYNQRKAEEALNLVLSDAKIKKYSPDGLTNEDLDNMIKNIGGIVDPENQKKVTVDGYDFEIDRDKLTIIESLGENPNITPGGSQGGGEESKKQEAILTLSSTSGTIVYPNDGTITITQNTSDGELSVSSSDDSIASANISGNQITIIPKLINESEKEVIITVKTAETKKFKEQVATYTGIVKQGGITINAIPNTIQHDGTAYSAFSRVEVTPEDAIVEYSLNDGTYQSEIPMITEVGEYTITIKATKAGYETKETSVTVTVLESVARVGNAYYNTLQRAINAVPTTNTNTTVVVLKNITEDVSVKENMNVTLDLNNCTLTGTITNSGTIDISGGTVISEGQTITNQAGGKMAISGGTINGTGDTFTINNNKDGELVIIGGILTSENSAVLSNSGTTEISGTAKIEGKTSGKVGISNYGVLDVTGGTMTSLSNVINNRAGGKATISGGTINGTGDTFTIHNRKDGELVITGGILTSEVCAVLANLGTTEISGTTKIEGKTSGKVGISNEGVLNVKGGTLTSLSNVINNRTGGKATISGGMITGTGSSPTLYNNTDAEITITGGTIMSEVNCTLYNNGTTEISGTAKLENKTDKIVLINNMGILQVKGGTMTSPGNAIYGREATSVIEISGGTIIGTGNYDTIYILLGTFKMTAGTVTNSVDHYGVYNVGGTSLSHTGGTISKKNF